MNVYRCGRLSLGVYIDEMSDLKVQLHVNFSGMHVFAGILHKTVYGLCVVYTCTSK